MVVNSLSCGMNRYHYSQIGSFHVQHNEDAWVCLPLEQSQSLLAVMDGCSMGKESHFAATLFAKILRKLAQAYSYQQFITKEKIRLTDSLKYFVKELFEELSRIQNQLLLEREELLSTLMIAVVDEIAAEAEVLTVGDGLVAYNGNFQVYEQDNCPDYLGYHLKTPFEDWWQAQDQRLHLRKLNDLSLCSDGIFSWQTFEAVQEEIPSETACLEYLLVDQTWAEEDSLLLRKVRKLERIDSLKPTDDLTIVRCIW